MSEEVVDVLVVEYSDPRPQSSHEGLTGTEGVLLEVLADLVGWDRVSVDGNFFDDLGANSLTMAHFCARVRKRPELPAVSMRDVYRHPSVRSLAGAMTVQAAATVAVPAPASAPDEVSAPPTSRTDVRSSTRPLPPRASSRQYVYCGALQALIFVAYSALGVLVMVNGYTWVGRGSGVVDIYLRSVVFGTGGFVAMCAMPVLAKWVLVGRWKHQEFPVWSLQYVRFWTVKALLHSSPMMMFAGNPIFSLYLRALGARVGRNVTILSPHVPVCTDLLTIGEGTVIRKDAFLQGYRAHGGHIQTGSVTLGRDVFIGEKTVLDINTSMGDGAQLGHTSALYAGQSVPAGERWHGSPAQRTQIDYVRVPPATCSTFRRTSFAVASLLQILLVYLPLAIGALYMLMRVDPTLAAVLSPDAVSSNSTRFYVVAAVLSLAGFLALMVVGLVVMFGLARLMSLTVKPDTVYPLYGFHYSVHRTVARFTNLKFFKWLLGDSSYIVYYLQGLGYDLSRVEQTGSNFGTEVQHETPYLASVGSGTMVADGLSIINADYSSTSFRLSRTSIGAQNFLGNNIAYPSGGRTGDNCLLATKVMVPLEGEVHEGVGLLGSPSFEIPRSVERDIRFDRFRTGRRNSRLLRSKNRFNLRSMGLFLFLRWLHLFLLTLLSLLELDFGGVAGAFVLIALAPLTLVCTALFFILVERVILRFGRLQPMLCSIYQPYFWWHERLWKVPDHYLNLFNGTPFKNLVWRLLGVRIGRRVFDDGAYMTERTLTAVGDDATLNVGSKLQCHSQEDGTFKSEHITVGARATLGVGAFVHYGVAIGDDAVLEADSFLMKGEEIPSRSRWGGNPAAEIAQASTIPATRQPVAVLA